MMILALDTCLGALSVALRYETAGPDVVVREAYEERETGHAERLMPMVGEVLAGAGRVMGDVDRIAVTTGPGTFTGVRIGVAAARGFALATGKPVVGVTSLEVMALRAQSMLGLEAGEHPLVVAVDARREALYAAAFVPRTLAILARPALIAAEAAGDWLGALSVGGAPFAGIVVGSGGPVIAATTRARGLEIDARLPRLQPHARFLARLAANREPAPFIEPFYLREPDVRPQPPPIARAP